MLCFNLFLNIFHTRKSLTLQKRHSLRKGHNFIDFKRVLQYLKILLPKQTIKNLYMQQHLQI